MKYNSETDRKQQNKLCDTVKLASPVSSDDGASALAFRKSQ